MIKMTALRQFLAACSTRNFTTAAEMLGVSQPALTQAIGKLERQLDVDLFDRTSRPLGLTPYGEVLLNYAHRMEQDAEDLADKLAEISGDGRSDPDRLRAGLDPRARAGRYRLASIRADGPAHQPYRGLERRTDAAAGRGRG